MDDDEQARPSTSKQGQDKPNKTNSSMDLEKHEKRDSSETSMSNTHTEDPDSRVEMAHDRPKITRRKKKRKSKERKPRGRPAGRVEKKSLRQPTRRSKRIKENKRSRDLSVSTIFTRLSSNVSMTRGCSYCGHRCCRRRFEMKKNRRNFCKRDKLHLKCISTQTSDIKDGKCVQVGSRCLMLSPLCLNTNNILPEAPTPEEQGASEITPEMIYQALRTLTMWQEEVNTDYILDYIMRNYPVGSGENLLTELTEKLRIAVIAGIVTQTKQDSWCLSCSLLRQKLTKNHVTLFWEAYGDTMKPVTKKPDATPPPSGQDQKNNSVRHQVPDVLPIDITLNYI